MACMNPEHAVREVPVRVFTCCWRAQMRKQDVAADGLLVALPVVGLPSLSRRGARLDQMMVCRRGTAMMAQLAVALPSSP